MRVRAEIARILRDLVVNGAFASSIVPDKFRWRLLKLAGKAIDPCRVAPKSFFGSGPLTIGEGSMLSSGLFLDPSAGIRIGRNARIGMRTLLITASHRVGPTEALRTDRSPGTESHAPIRIHDNVWIGANVTILPGVEIGPGCVIAAGAVVNRACLSNGLYAGVPARRVRDLPV